MGLIAVSDVAGWGYGMHVLDHQFMVMPLLGEDLFVGIPVYGMDCRWFPLEAMLEVLHERRCCGGFPYGCLVVGCDGVLVER